MYNYIPNIIPVMFSRWFCTFEPELMLNYVHLCTYSRQICIMYNLYTLRLKVNQVVSAGGGENDQKI